MTAANGIPMARCGHRREYSRGVSAHVAGDFAVALRAFRAGARRGYAPAQFVLGSMYHKGQGVVADQGEAFFWYLAAADKGEPRAAYVLGCMYCMGEVFDEDPVDQAFQWFRQSAEWGYAPAQFSLGTMFASGTDIPRDPHMATKWFLLAAVQGIGKRCSSCRRWLPRRNGNNLLRKRNDFAKRDPRPCPVFQARSGSLFGIRGI